jgi:hypothetical protein
MKINLLVRIVPLLAGFLLPVGSYSIENYFVGSRYKAMANCGVAIPDVWSVSSNQAGIAFTEKPTIAIYHEQRFMIKELNLSSFAAVVPVRYGYFGTQLTYFGYSKYHELKAGLAYALKLNKKLSAAIQLNYFSTFIPTSESKYQQINFECGLMFKLNENFMSGFHVFNPIPEKRTQNNEIMIPTNAQLGFAYNIRKIVTMTAETEAGYDIEPIYKFGLEYFPVKLLALRMGISSGSINYSFGLGYILRRFQTNIAFTNHEVLGFTPHFDISFSF